MVSKVTSPSHSDTDSGQGSPGRHMALRVHEKASCLHSPTKKIFQSWNNRRPVTPGPILGQCFHRLVLHLVPSFVPLLYCLLRVGKGEKASLISFTVDSLVAIKVLWHLGTVLISVVWSFKSWYELWCQSYSLRNLFAPWIWERAQQSSSTILVTGSTVSGESRPHVNKAGLNEWGESSGTLLSTLEPLTNHVGPNPDSNSIINQRWVIVRVSHWMCVDNIKSSPYDQCWITSFFQLNLDNI